MKSNERLKPQYVIAKQETHSYFRIIFANYVARRNRYMRSFSCRQELSKTVMHSIEYSHTSEYPVKIRARRFSGLPDPWDDYFAEDLTYKSWKDRTKRSKQYYKVKSPK